MKKVLSFVALITASGLSMAQTSYSASSTYNAVNNAWAAPGLNGVVQSYSYSEMNGNTSGGASGDSSNWGHNGGTGGNIGDAANGWNGYPGTGGGTTNGAGGLSIQYV